MTFVDRLLRRVTRSRRLVLGLALAIGLACALAAGEDRSHFEHPLIGDAFAADGVRILVAADTKGTEPSTTEKAETPGKSRPSVDAEISISESGVTIRKRGGNEEPHVVVGDMEFESFEEFVEKAPWLAALVFMVTGLVFLMPLLIIGLIIWYKVRSNRMRNETMLKLAERGVVTPTDAVTAMAAGSSAPSFATMPSTAPLYEQVKQVRKRAAWSDLRKGVLMLGAGLGLTFWSMLDDGSANSVGLVLLFVGIGFIVLWYFEERELTPPRDRGPGPSGGA
jgi:Domain of unknown function (DUF6249)